jgi:hypothetical protein
MWLERLPWPIPIESPPFVEPNEPVAVEFGRQVIFSAMEHVGRESRIIQQHSLVVANILDDDVGHRGSFVHDSRYARSTPRILRQTGSHESRSPCLGPNLP